MCTCVQRDKIPRNGSIRIFDYVFECTDGAAHRHIETVEGQSNDMQAKHLAEQKCMDRHKDN